jgi:sugar lactone lactonase YvrE
MGAQETRSLSTLVEGGTYFESPRWHDGRWWVSDFYAHVVLAFEADGTTERILDVPGQPSGLGWLPDGSLLVVSMRDRRVLRCARTGEVSLHADIAGLCTGHANDMAVDPRGHAYVGNFGFDLMGGETPATAALVHITPDGRAEIAAEDLAFPNGAVITPDGSTLIVAETIGARLTAFTIGHDGALTDRRVWAQVAPAAPMAGVLEMAVASRFAPDGCALDAAGHIWAADPSGGRCALVAQGGEVVEEIPAPHGLDFFACALGGPDGHTLLLCAAPDFLEHNRVGATDAVLLTTTVDVPAA